MVLISNVTLAIPTLALLTILPLTFLGFGRPSVVVALAVFAVPPLLANAYTGVRQADPEARDAARGMGFSGWQLLRRVELPLAVPYLAAGFRTAAVQVVATAALASFVNGGGLGQIIRAGFGLDIAAGRGQILAGGLLVAGLAVLVELVLALVERWSRRARCAARGGGRIGVRPTRWPAPETGLSGDDPVTKIAQVVGPAVKDVGWEVAGGRTNDRPSDTRPARTGRAGTRKAGIMRARTRLAIGAVGALAAAGLLTGCGDAGSSGTEAPGSRAPPAPAAPRSPVTSWSPSTTTRSCRTPTTSSRRSTRRRRTRSSSPRWTRSRRRWTRRS